MRRKLPSEDDEFPPLWTRRMTLTAWGGGLTILFLLVLLLSMLEHPERFSTNANAPRGAANSTETAR